MESEKTLYKMIKKIKLCWIEKYGRHVLQKCYKNAQVQNKP
jgi:hypothetical protein